MKSHELLSHTLQLKEFVSVMKDALRTVVSLDLIVSLTGDTNLSLEDGLSSDTWITNMLVNQSQSAVPANLSQAAATALASLLVAACPHVSKLAVGGELGQKAMGLFFSGWPRLNSLEMTDRNLSVAIWMRRMSF